MAEQTTFGVKMDTEQKEILQKKISASGMTAAEYVGAMMTAYDAAQNRETLVDDRELKLIETHLSRINEVVIGMAKARRDENESASQTIAELREQLKSAKAEIIDVQETAKQEALELNGHINLLNEEMRALSQETDNQVIEAANARGKAEEGEAQARRMFDKLDAVSQQLTAQAEELRLKVENSEADAKAAREEVRVSNATAASINVELTEVKRLLDTEKEKAARMVSDLERQLEFERQNHARAVESVRQSMGLDKRQALLEVESKALEQRRALADELEALRREFAAVKSENMELNAK